MRKTVLILLITFIFALAGCSSIQIGSNNASEPSAAGTSAPDLFHTKTSPKPNASPSEEGPPLETVKPSPSAATKPSPSTTAKPSASASSNPSVSATTKPSPSLSPSSSATPKPSPSVSPSPASTAMQVTDVKAPKLNPGQHMSSADDGFWYDDRGFRADYDGDGTADILYADFTKNFKTGNDVNKPVRITMTIGNKTTVYENTWNDGVYIYATDFDTSDKYFDIFIVASGTDVSATVDIYRYDGSSISKYRTFKIVGDTKFSYDEKGMIYFKGNYNNSVGIPVLMNYKTGNIDAIS